MLKKIPDSIQSFHHDYHEVELDLETIYLIRIFALKYLNRPDPQPALVQQVHLKEIRCLLIRHRICRAGLKTNCLQILDIVSYLQVVKRKNKTINPRMLRNRLPMHMSANKQIETV